MAAKKKASAKNGKAERHEGPVFALAIHGTKVVSAGSDGRVLAFSFGKKGLTCESVLHENAKAPITTLATMGDDLVGAGKTLFVWDAIGKALAKAALPAPAIDLAVRGDDIFVLAGGKVHRFTRAGKTLKATGSWKHGAGDASELDVDDKGARAVVVRQKTVVDVLDLAKKKTLAKWERKPPGSRRVAPVSVRFAPDQKSLLSVMTGDYRLVRVKDTSGRITGEVSSLDSSSNGPLVFDAKRSVAAVTSTGEDVEVVDIEKGRTLFFLSPAITPSAEKSLASMSRIPSFKQIAPGFFVRSGSTAAPDAPRTQSAVAIGEGGARVAAAFVSGEIIVAETQTGKVASTHRGMLFTGRCKAQVPRPDPSGSVRVGDELWLLQKNGRFLVLDAAKQEIREDDRNYVFEGEAEMPGVELVVDEDSILAVSDERVVRWSRKDGAVLAAHTVPENKGSHLDLEGNRILFAPLDKVSHEGFDLLALDLTSGRTKHFVRFDRDEKRFPHGNRKDGWLAFGSFGTQATLTIWAGKGLTVAQVFAFDLATGKLGGKLPWAAEGDGRFVCESDDDITVRDLEKDEIIHRRPYGEGERYRSTIAYEPHTEIIAASVSSSMVGVWDGKGRRHVTLPGHRDVNDIQLFPNGRTAIVTDRFWLRVWDIE